MSCTLCESGNRAEFQAEMTIHFSGLRHLDKPGLWLFPQAVVCLARVANATLENQLPTSVENATDATLGSGIAFSAGR
jgi:hypothetical protein